MAVSCLHGDMNQNQRDTIMDTFRKGKTTVLIATDVAARGIDVKDIDLVINCDIPDKMEYYVHRIGRTGRAGSTGRACTLVSPQDKGKIVDIERRFRIKLTEEKAIILLSHSIKIEEDYKGCHFTGQLLLLHTGRPFFSLFRPAAAYSFAMAFCPTQACVQGYKWH